MRPQEPIVTRDMSHHTASLISHLTQRVDKYECHRLLITYGLWVLAGRVGVVVIVAGGHIGVGVAPLVLHAPGGSAVMTVVSVLRPAAVVMYNKYFPHHLLPPHLCL